MRIKPGHSFLFSFCKSCGEKIKVAQHLEEKEEEEVTVDAPNIIIIIPAALT